MMTAPTKYETEIVAHPALPLIVITRVFDAPAEKLYRAYTDSELVAQWLGPRSSTMRIDSWDCRTGGIWHYSSVWVDNEVGFFGC